MNNRRIPWTRQELDALIPKVEARLQEAEASQEEEVRPINPQTREECRDYLSRLMEIATARPLTLRECFLHGQFVACLEQAVQAEMLGKKGRYFVISEDQINARILEERNPQ